MNKSWALLFVIISLVGCVSAISGANIELRPGEAKAELLFNQGIGQAWIGGNPPSSDSYDFKYSQFYSTYKGASPEKHIGIPKKFAAEDEKPSTIYFSYQMEGIPYSQYQTYADYMGGDSLWIQGASSWAQYVQVPKGSSLFLRAVSAAGGNGYLYEISPDGKLSKNSFYFYPGSSQIDFCADKIGQHIILFAIGSRVSNAIVIDVMSYPSFQPPDIGYPPTQILPPSTNPPLSGDTPVTIVSQGMRGYQIFLDGGYLGTEGTGGDALDGRFSFRVVGNQNHNIRVYDGQFNYPKTMYFQRGVQKLIYVEPGRAVYI